MPVRAATYCPRRRALPSRRNVEARSADSDADPYGAISGANRLRGNRQQQLGSIREAPHSPPPCPADVPRSLMWALYRVPGPRNGSPSGTGSGYQTRQPVVRPTFSLSRMGPGYSPTRRAADYFSSLGRLSREGAFLGEFAQARPRSSRERTRKCAQHSIRRITYNVQILGRRGRVPRAEHPCSVLVFRFRVNNADVQVVQAIKPSRIHSFACELVIQGLNVRIHK